MHVLDTGHMSQNLWVHHRGGGASHSRTVFPPEGQLEGTFREHGFNV